MSAGDISKRESGLISAAVEPWRYDRDYWKARAAKCEEALRTLERWDMLTLDAGGHGVATADAPWARALIADALAVSVPPAPKEKP